MISGLSGRAYCETDEADANEAPFLWNKPFFRTGNTYARLLEIKMNKRDQELLEKQLWGFSSKSPHNGIIILIIVAVFLVGMGIGDIVSKTKQADTHYAALISYPNGQD